MWAYIDETGNTGSNMIDRAQPVFMSAALVTKTNFDVLYGSQVRALAERLDQPQLHANVLGPYKIESLARDVLRLLKRAEARISLGRVVKLDHASLKFFDAIFDSGENRAVPWHIYNVRPLRYLLAIKCVSLLDEATVADFWDLLLGPRQPDSADRLGAILDRVTSRVFMLPDERSRMLIGDALRWARANPEAIILHASSPRWRKGHVPNVALFPMILGGIDAASTAWKRPVIEIVHDRTSEFAPTLREWHELLAATRKRGNLVSSAVRPDRVW